MSTRYERIYTSGTLVVDKVEKQVYTEIAGSSFWLSTGIQSVETETTAPVYFKMGLASASDGNQDGGFYNLKTDVIELGPNVYCSGNIYAANFINTGVAMEVSNETYGPTWDGITVVAPSKNALYDKIESLTAAQIDFVPTGNIASTDVQTALLEIDDEKLTREHEGSSFPVSPKIGEMFWHTIDEAWYRWDGYAWIQVSGGMTNSSIANGNVFAYFMS